MTKISIRYEGDKHCELTHGPSGARIATDAPIDNNGKGQDFSPTDLVAAALGSCMITVMAITADKEKISLAGLRCEIEKEMATAPRRVARLVAVLHMPRALDSASRSKLEEIARNCPVAKSLSLELRQEIRFEYDA